MIEAHLKSVIDISISKIKIVFATGNPHKVREIRSILKNFPIIINKRNLKGSEIQTDRLKDVAKSSILGAVHKSKNPTIVEDAGLFIKPLQGFPGTHTAYVYKTIGNKGIIKLLKGESNRRAFFKSVIAYCLPYHRPQFFTGKVNGNITLQERGLHGFGFDPIFEPKTSIGKTFGEMTLEEKNRYSHRAIASIKFAKWLLRH